VCLLVWPGVPSRDGDGVKRLMLAPLHSLQTSVWKRKLEVKEDEVQTLRGTVRPSCSQHAT